jgi:hypothetical protein
MVIMDHIAAPLVDILRLVQHSELVVVDVINNNTISSLQWKPPIQLLHVARAPKLQSTNFRHVALE